MNKLYILSVISILLISNHCFGEDFIKNIYGVNIHNIPDAYNASFIEYEEGYLMAFRYDRYLYLSDRPSKYNAELFRKTYKNFIGLVKLDQNFNQVGSAYFCKPFGKRAHDPRLFRVGDDIHLIYTSSRPEDPDSFRSSMLCSSKIRFIDDGFTVEGPTPLNALFQKNFEKNWVPFDYKGALMMGYTIDPHTVITPLENGECIYLFTTSPMIDWNYGIIRGGTPAILVDDEYLAFFHSSVSDPSTGWRTYYIGAYTFQSKPPFNLTRISPKPFSHPDFYSSSNPPWTGSQVLFPLGLVVKENRILISYGENDGAIKIMEIDKDKLYESLEVISNNQ